MQILCFIGNKKPPPRLVPGGGMLYRRDYVQCRTAAEHFILILVAKIRIKSDICRHYIAQYLAKLHTILLKI